MRIFRPVLATLVGVAALTWLGPGSALAEEPLELEEEKTLDLNVIRKLAADGQQLAGQGQHLDASLRFYDIVENGDPTRREVQDAQFQLAVNLFQLKFYQSALSRLEPIIELGKEHPHFADSLPYLLKIARAAGAGADVLYKIAQYPVEVYPPEMADELHFLVGQHFFSEDALDEALARFKQVTTKNSELYVRARYLEGVIHTVQSKLAIEPTAADPERLKEAANNFKAILRFQRDHDDNEIINKTAAMTHLALGRLFFSTRQYNVAVRYYDQVERATQDWLSMLFEVSWVYFQLKNYPRALGNLHTLNSPYFEDQYFPESRVLQALILFYNCRYKEADAVVAQFVQDYLPLMKKLKEQITQFTDPNAFYAWLARLSKGGTAQFSEKFKRIFNAALADRKLRSKFRSVTTLNQEIQRLEERMAKNPQAQTMLDNLRGDVAAYRSLVIGEAGSLAQARLERVLKELRQHLAGALKIKGETLKAQRGALPEEVKAEQAAAAAARNEIVVDAEHFEWPFTGEYWKDELGSYVYDITSECKTAADAAAN